MANKKQHSELFKHMLSNFITEEDPLQAMLEWTTQQLMQIEAEQKVGAQKNEHNPYRKTYFSGKRVRKWNTRLGTTYLIVPKIRNGGYVPFFLGAKKRSEVALISLISEIYTNGVSTRKVDRVAKQLGIESISAGQVSQIAKELDAQVKIFRQRPLEKEYPFVWIDAVYEKVRIEGKVISMAFMIAHGVTSAGKRSILAVEAMYDESKASWGNFFDKLKQRGVEKIGLCISDAHKGIQAALVEKLTGTSWQRCKVHFMRNIMVHIPHKVKKSFGSRLKQIWQQIDKKNALRVAKELIAEYAKKYPQAIEVLSSGLEDALQCYEWEHVDQKKISSTNVVERINREIRRRTRVVGSFPNKESALRLITAHLMEYSEDWETDPAYISSNKIRFGLKN